MPFSGNMFAPNSTGANNDHFFETAILWGNLIGNASDAHIAVSSDDDALVYVKGLFVGGEPGVHPNVTTNIDLGNLNGTNSLEMFYADRAHVAADLALNVDKKENGT